MKGTPVTTKRSRIVSVYLFGGLGNQLFQYFTGLSIAKATGAKLILRPFGKTSAIDRNDTLGIEAFEIEGTLICSRISPYWQEKMLRKFINAVSFLKLKKFFESQGIILSDSQSLLALINQKKKHLRFIGYFQNTKYLNFLSEKDGKVKLTIKNPTDWFKNLSILCLSAKPIMLHLRRGDYLKHSKTIGVLDFSYYKSALEIIRPANDSEIWIFYDSISTAKDFAKFAQLPESRTKIIEPPSESRDAESMIIMSQGSALIISNSTFSWWSAYLCEQKVKIFAPSVWFRNLPDSVNFIPKSWLTCLSSFES